MRMRGRGGVPAAQDDGGRRLQRARRHPYDGYGDAQPALIEEKNLFQRRCEQAVHKLLLDTWMSVLRLNKHDGR